MTRPLHSPRDPLDWAPDDVTGHREPPPLPGPGWHPELGEPAGISLARLSVLVVAAIVAARLVHLPVFESWALLVAVTSAAVLLVTNPWTALAAAGVTWLLGTGFLVNRFGVLSFGPGDRLRLAALVIAVGLTVLLSLRLLSHRLLGHCRPRPGRS